MFCNNLEWVSHQSVGEGVCLKIDCPGIPFFIGPIVWIIRPSIFLSLFNLHRWSFSMWFLRKNHVMCAISSWSWSLSQPNLNKWQDASPACICHVHPCSSGACSPCRHNESFHKHPRLLIIATYNLFWKCYSVDMLRKMLFLCIFWLWLVGNQAHLANADHTTYFCWLSPSLSLTKWGYAF